MRVRPIEHLDMEELLEAERSWKTALDPDFLTRVPLPWALDEDKIIELIRQPSTRAFVLEDEQHLIHGGFVFEFGDEHLEVVWFTIHPESDLGQTMEAMLSCLKSAVTKSKKRKSFSLYLHDREECDFRQLFRIIQRAGLKAQLVPDYFGDHDGWEMSYTAQSRQEAA